MKQIDKNARRKQVPDPDALKRYFISRCRDQGIRVTTQRLAVFQALAEDRTHPTADHLYSVLCKMMPSLSLSTVYRILESLERGGLIRRVSVSNGKARYDGNLVPHQHLVCRSCGVMTDLEDEALSRLRLPGVHFDGFIAEELDIRIMGTCSECRRAGSKSRENIGKELSGRRAVFRLKERIRWPS